MQELPNVIWLCSWYPNEEDPYRGDFIQRQAMALSSKVRLSVFHIVFGSAEKVTRKVVHETLTENIWYLKETNRLNRWLRIRRAGRAFLQAYQREFGQPDRVHLHIPLEMGLIALDWHQAGIPYFLSEHYGIYHPGIADHWKTRSFFFRYFLKRILAQSMNVVTVSRSLGEDMKNEGLIADFRVIPNVVNTDLFYPSDRKAMHQFTFVHVSGMDENKNVKGILEAAKHLKDEGFRFHLKLIGAADEGLRSLIGSHHLQGMVSLVPPIPYAEVAEQIKACHAGILFSWRETQSCVVLEWLCSGMPVITSRAGGVEELVTQENGILVNPGDVVALVAALRDMLKNYQRFNAEAISRDAAGKYNYQVVASQFMELYSS